MIAYVVQMYGDVAPTKEHVYCEDCSRYSHRSQVGRRTESAKSQLEHICCVPGTYEMAVDESPIHRAKRFHMSKHLIDAEVRNKDRNCGYFEPKAHLVDKKMVKV